MGALAWAVMNRGANILFFDCPPVPKNSGGKKWAA